MAGRRRSRCSSTPSVTCLAEKSDSTRECYHRRIGCALDSDPGVRTAQQRESSDPTPMNRRGEYAAGPRAGAGGQTVRVGVLLGGTMLGRRVLDDPQRVTVGQSPKNTFAIPADGLPRSFTILERTRAGYSLHFNEKMDGYVFFEAGQAPRTLRELRARASRRRGEFRVPLPRGARGRVVISDVTIPFQLLSPPAPARTAARSPAARLQLSALLAVVLLVGAA